MEYDLQKLYPVEIDPEETVFSFGVPSSFEERMVHTWEELRAMNGFGFVRAIKDAETDREYQLFSKNLDCTNDPGRALVQEVSEVRKGIQNVLEDLSLAEFEAGKSMDDYWRVLLKMSADLSASYDPGDFRLHLEGHSHGPHVKAQEMDGRLVVRMKARRLLDLPPMALYVGSQM